ncbi:MULTISPECIES: ABC transporter ATP-binding protein [Anaerococcus]|uniref:ABC transporter ATP-binding protein n=1 Tax=Anaerococcus nagyae TaxID=1755241 RepID=A0A3E2TG81_9FIRM|nr:MULTISPECIES: ABC transporter ATP-binding protein [Anaerococcus]MDU2353263.1 ABC transporter ATP-binding protein [Anaerococcus sp.]RGB75094.1 ABC transporter ATP-binding protein [Anaerococcus nagyae]
MEKKSYKNKELLKRFKPYYRPYKNILTADLLAAALTTVSSLVLPILLSYLTDWAQMGLLDVSRVTKVGIIFVLTKILELAARYFMQSLGHIMGAKIERDMRSDVFNHLLTMDTEFFNETKIGVLMSRITTDLFDITEFAHHVPEEFLVGALKLIISFIVLLTINWKLALIIYVIIPIMFVVSSKKRKEFREATLNVKKQIGDINSGVEDTLLGISVVKSFANEEIEKSKFEISNDKFVDIKKERYYDMAGFFMINEAFSGLMYAILIFVGGYFVIDDKISPGNLIAFTMYLNMLVAAIERLINFTDVYQAGATGIERFVEVMDMDNTIFDDDQAIKLDDVSGKIEFDNVYFKYPETREDEPYVLENINFNVNVGENIALVGPSGAGKTTISKLIPRFYDIDRGSIKIDDKDIKDITLESLRDNIGIVQQDVYLFGGTVKDNIRYGKDDATDEEIIRAAELAGATEFINDLPYGFDTYIGERGVKLSGGQKQRISIARVFLKNPPILILDEATSALDNKSEAIVQKSLENLSEGRTTITIAHRLSTIINADEILVLTYDGIVERGNHKELLAKKGKYYNLYNSNNEELFG